MASRDREVEIKLAIESPSAARRLLSKAGFRVSSRRAFESNTVFDTPGGELRAGRRLLRLRETAGKVKTTYKGPPEDGPHKSREELETDVASSRAFGAILDRLGFRPTFRYEKYRAEYRRPGSSGIATVDETPIGTYLELEGNPRWIDRTARELGFPPEKYITGSYGTLYLDWCRQQNVEPHNMVFGRSVTSKGRKRRA
jgi:adenylate cyclase, class 2